MAYQKLRGNFLLEKMLPVKVSKYTLPTKHLDIEAFLPDASCGQSHYGDSQTMKLTFICSPGFLPHHHVLKSRQNPR